MSELSQGIIQVVLFYLSSYILVKIEVLAISIVVEVLEHSQDTYAHGLDSVSTKEYVMEGTPGMAAILGLL